MTAPTDGREPETERKTYPPRGLCCSGPGRDAPIYRHYSDCLLDLGGRPKDEDVIW